MAKRPTPARAKDVGTQREANGNVLDIAATMTRARYSDRALVGRICQRLESGHSMRSAGMAEGLSDETVASWISRVKAWLIRFEADEPDDREGMVADAPPVALFEAVVQIRKAIATSMGDAEGRTYNGDNGPLAWLERLHRDVWGKAAETATVVNVSQGPSELAAFLSQLTK